jgi:hypothetical protein
MYVLDLDSGLIFGRTSQLSEVTTFVTLSAVKGKRAGSRDASFSLLSGLRLTNSAGQGRHWHEIGNISTLRERLNGQTCDFG